MTLTKFLLIDGALLLVGLPLLLMLQGGKGFSSLLGILNSDNLLDQTSINIPSLKELLELESLARRKGSGIEFDNLVGLWKFVSVWKQGTDKEDSISSSLLRLFSASLELKKKQTNEELLKFDITNSIQFGTLLLRFTGSGEVKGSQPLLPFFFEFIELKLGRSVLFSRSFDLPDEKNRPFFALIAMGDKGCWLSARGRGGGLALWLRD